METPALLVFTILLVLCHFATVTLGAPTFSEPQVKACPQNVIENTAQIEKGHDLTKTFDELNVQLKASEPYFKKAEEHFQPPPMSKRWITSTLSKWLLRRNSPIVEFLDPETSKTHFFISIPDLEGKNHVYVVQMRDPKLGWGWNGDVYLAKDIKIPDEFVAIKITRKKSEPKGLILFGTPRPLQTSWKDELKGLKLVGELLGSVEKADFRSRPELFLAIPFVPGITLKQLAEKTYDGKPVYEYWMDENNKGYHTLLHRIACDVFAPMVNKYLIHTDLHAGNMMVAEIDENFVPRKTDPATGLQYFRGIDFATHRKILDGDNILDDIHRVGTQVLLDFLPHSPFGVTTPICQETIEIFPKGVIDGLDKSKFDIKLDEDGMPLSVRKKKGMVTSTVSTGEGSSKIALKRFLLRQLHRIAKPISYPSLNRIAKPISYPFPSQPST